MIFNAASIDYTIICQAPDSGSVYPYFRSADGKLTMECISPLHGRSFVMAQRPDGKYVVSKGNGLSYTQCHSLRTGEFGNNIWGLIPKQDAIRDFILGQECAGLGIRTNHMEYVLELEKEITLSNGCIVKPVLLQYTVECPYRICDAPFMPVKLLNKEVEKWENFNSKGYDTRYLIAADVLVRNLRKLHDNEFLHNAIHIQNYTWALELLDFELACSPKHPYDEETDRRYAKDLFQREILYTYEVINYIAWCLDEHVRHKMIDDVFKEYGFDLIRLKPELGA